MQKCFDKLFELTNGGETYSHLEKIAANEMPCVYFSKDVSGKYLDCDDKLAQTLGFEAGSHIIGARDQDLCWKNSADIFLQNDKQILVSKTSGVFVESGQLVTGIQSTALSYKFPLKIKSKKIIGIVSFSFVLNQEKFQPDESIQHHIKKEFSALLTKRQIECLYLLVKGMTMKEIAYILKLSPRTVEHYIETIKQKLNCHSRSELISKVLT